MMLKAGKAWGETRPLFNRNGVEIHRIAAVVGGFCSKHRHLHKHNMFVVERGSLQVDVWTQDEEMCDVTVLREGDCCTVAPGVYHRFTALEETVAYEVYWVELLEDDIDRKDRGGRVNR